MHWPLSDYGSALQQEKFDNSSSLVGTFRKIRTSSNSDLAESEGQKRLYRWDLIAHGCLTYGYIW